MRTIRSGHRGVRGYATVMRKQVAFESSLEADFLQIVACDTDLRAVTEQPIRIDFDGPDGRRRRYTPDYLLTYGDDLPRSFLVEIKHRDDLKRDWGRLKPGFVAARRLARERGWRFHILTEREIRGPYLDNLRFLRVYRDIDPQPEIEERLVRAVAILGDTTPDAALATAFATKDGRIAAVAPLWRLVATGRLQANLLAPLTMDTPLWVIHGEGFL